MTDQNSKRGRKSMPLDREPAKGKHKSIIGTSVPYIAPKRDVWIGSVVGYRPHKNGPRPVIQPNRV